MILVLKIGIRFRNFVRLRGEAIVARGSRTDITRPPPLPLEQILSFVIRAILTEQLGLKRQ